MQNVETVFVSVCLTIMEMVMFPVDLNVSSTVTVPVIKLVSGTSVRIHVHQELVGKELFVMWLTTMCSVLVLLEPLEVHLFNVNQYRMNQCTQTHVNHHLVDQTVNVVKSIIKLCVHVCQITSVVLQLVDQNVLLIQIVRLTRLV
uniref:Uncharacterized protein n=1 Tax=Cacopsylla melanoneura TaxID=428564 RepID=A0A8D8V961_9HEMI